MSGDTDATLAAEFRLFSRHLARVETTPYQLQKYIAAHGRFPLEPGDGFERWLLALARSGPMGVWLADGYSGFLARKSVVRAKLVLAFALMETAGPSFAALDRPDPGGPLAIFAMGLRGVEGALGLLLGIVVAAPAKLWFAAIAARR